MRRFSLIPTDSLRFRSTRVSHHNVPHLSPTGLSPSVTGLSRPLRLDEPKSLSGTPAVPTYDPTTPNRQRTGL